MATFRRMMKLVHQAQVVRFPRHRLATFGDSEIQYNLVSPLSQTPVKCALRTGLVTAERPKILTPEALSERFQGFGPDAGDFEKLLQTHFQEALRALEYNFRNRLESTREHALDAREMAKNIQRDLDERDVARAAVIYAPEEGWSVALMKFIMEETSQSFMVNVRELEERGMFDPAQAEFNRRRRIIEDLFFRARRDPGVLKQLAATLKEYGVFEEYQDRFLQLARGA